MSKNCFSFLFTYTTTVYFVLREQGQSQIEIGRAIHSICDKRQQCHVCDHIDICSWDSFTAPLTLESHVIQSHRQVECCFFGDETCVSITWMCKRQTALSHRNTEGAIINLDAGLRMEEIQALDLWECVVDVVAPARGIMFWECLNVHYTQSKQTK